VNLGGRLVFAANSGATGRELYVSDGTVAGTTVLADIVPGPGSSRPNHLLAADGDLYFFANGFMRLAAGATVPEKLADALPQPLYTTALPGEPYSGPRGCVSDKWVAFGGNVYFLGETVGDLGWRLWRSDGTAAGTKVIGPTSLLNPCSLTVYNNQIYF